jgi:hypothetical protein
VQVSLLCIELIILLRTFTRKRTKEEIEKEEKKKKNEKGEILRRASCPVVPSSGSFFCFATTA